MTTAHPDTRKLRLADHVRACVVGDQVVLLDLDRSRYFGMKGPQSAAAIRALGLGEVSPSRARGDEEKLLAPLLRSRMLTTEQPGALASSDALPPAAASSAGDDPTPVTTVRLCDILQFVFAVAVAALWLRWRSLNAIADAVRDLQRAHRGRVDVHPNFQLRRAVAVFDRLRPLAITSRDKCLLDSLALAIFLGRRGLTASWVIGVATRPFLAHSWIQDRSEVLNDVPENVRRFTPILVV